MTVRVIADDHPLVRQGLRAALAPLPEVEVVAEAATGQEAIREAVLHRPDVVVMDLQMPELNGIDATRELTCAVPTAAVLVLTMFDDDSVFAAMWAGARGYVLKGAEQQEIARAITAVAHRRGHLRPGGGHPGAHLLRNATGDLDPVPGADRPRTRGPAGPWRHDAPSRSRCRGSRPLPGRVNSRPPRNATSSAGNRRRAAC
jgi:DNA-binding NarL/FixJ family response regulator